MMRSLFLALIGLLAAGVAHAAPVRTENAEAELVSSRAVVARGETFLIGLRQAVRPG